MTDSSPESSKPPSLREDALAIIRRLRDNGHTAYFAGGSVRDMLLGLDPKDYDVATDAPPDRVRQLFSNTQAVGAAFGVILVRHGPSQIEVATFRTDDKYEDGRRPTAVHFTTAQEDAKRRDFTINGLFFDPIENNVIDYIGGQQDLQSKTLRAIGDPDHRFAEDHLRLLRAVRFAARFDLTIDPATAQAIQRHADHLKRISPERIADELRLTFQPATRNAAWRMLQDLSLADVVFRHWPPMTVPSRLWFLFFALGDAPAPLGLALATAFLSRSVSADHSLSSGDLMQAVRHQLEPAPVAAAVHAMRKALKISNDEADQMGDTLLQLRPLLAVTAPTLVQKKRFLAHPAAPLARRLLDAMNACDLFRGRITMLQPEFDELLKTDFTPPPLITGDDLTAAGFTPGPIFKRILDSVYDAQLEGRITTKDQALAMARDLSKQ